MCECAYFISENYANINGFPQPKPRTIEQIDDPWDSIFVKETAYRNFMYENLMNQILRMKKQFISVILSVFLCVLQSSVWGNVFN